MAIISLLAHCFILGAGAQSVVLAQEGNNPISPKDSVLAIHVEPLAETVATGSPMPLRLTAENRTEKSLCIVRPRVKRLQMFGFCGYWKVTVQTPSGTEYAVLNPIPGPVPPLQPEDLIELEPGESVGAVINIAGFRPVKPTRPAKSPLNVVVGRIDIQVSYHVKVPRRLISGTPELPANTNPDSKTESEFVFNPQISRVALSTGESTIHVDNGQSR